MSGLYPQLGAPSACVMALQSFFEKLMPAGQIPFADLPRVTFDNGFVTPPPLPAGDTTDPTLLFVAEALDQHSRAYVLELIPELVATFPGIHVTPKMAGKVSGACRVLTMAAARARAAAVR